MNYLLDKIIKLYKVIYDYEIEKIEIEYIQDIIIENEIKNMEDFTEHNNHFYSGKNDKTNNREKYKTYNEIIFETNNEKKEKYNFYNELVGEKTKYENWNEKIGITKNEKKEKTNNEKIFRTDNEEKYKIYNEKFVKTNNDKKEKASDEKIFRTDNEEKYRICNEKMLNLTMK